MVNSVNGYGPLWFLVGEGESEIFPKTNVSDFCKPGLFQQRTPWQFHKEYKKVYRNIVQINENSLPPRPRENCCNTLNEFLILSVQRTHGTQRTHETHFDISMEEWGWRLCGADSGEIGHFTAAQCWGVGATMGFVFATVEDGECSYHEGNLCCSGSREEYGCWMCDRVVLWRCCDGHGWSWF